MCWPSGTKDNGRQVETNFYILTMFRMESTVESYEGVPLIPSSKTLEAWDYVVIVVYFVAVLAVGLWVRRTAYPVYRDPD
jgi:hypothetical protein